MINGTWPFPGRTQNLDSQKLNIIFNRIHFSFTIWFHALCLTKLNISEIIKSPLCGRSNGRLLYVHCGWRLSCVCARSDLLKMDNPLLYPEILLNRLPVSLQEFNIHFCSVNAFIMWHLLQVCSVVNNLDHDLCSQVLQMSVQVSNTGCVTSVLSSFKSGLIMFIDFPQGLPFWSFGFTPAKCGLLLQSNIFVS